MKTPPTHLVQQDVSCHEHGVCHEPRPHVLALLQGLLLELDHAIQPADGRDTLQQPVELSMGCDVALHKYGRLQADTETAQWDHFANALLCVLNVELHDEL